MIRSRESGRSSAAPGVVAVASTETWVALATANAKRVSEWAMEGAARDKALEKQRVEFNAERIEEVFAPGEMIR